MTNSERSRWWVYIVRCADESLYTGVTTELRRRLHEHNVGIASKYTRSRRPVKLAYWETAKGRGAALRREAAIKRLARSAKEALISPKRQRKRR